MHRAGHSTSASCTLCQALVHTTVADTQYSQANFPSISLPIRKPPSEGRCVCSNAHPMNGSLAPDSPKQIGPGIEADGGAYDPQMAADLLILEVRL